MSTNHNHLTQTMIKDMSDHKTTRNNSCRIDESLTTNSSDSQLESNQLNSNLDLLDIASSHTSKQLDHKDSLLVETGMNDTNVNVSTMTIPTTTPSVVGYSHVLNSTNLTNSCRPTDLSAKQQEDMLGGADWLVRQEEVEYSDDLEIDPRVVDSLTISKHNRLVTTEAISLQVQPKSSDLLDFTSIDETRSSTNPLVEGHIDLSNPDDSMLSSKSEPNTTTSHVLVQNSTMNTSQVISQSDVKPQPKVAPIAPPNLFTDPSFMGYDFTPEQPSKTSSANTNANLSSMVKSASTVNPTDTVNSVSTVESLDSNACASTVDSSSSSPALGSTISPPNLFTDPSFMGYDFTSEQPSKTSSVNSLDSGNTTNSSSSVNTCRSLPAKEITDRAIDSLVAVDSLSLDHKKQPETVILVKSHSNAKLNLKATDQSSVDPVATEVVKLNSASTEISESSLEKTNQQNLVNSSNQQHQLDQSKQAVVRDSLTKTASHTDATVQSSTLATQFTTTPSTAIAPPNLFSDPSFMGFEYNSKVNNTDNKVSNTVDKVSNTDNQVNNSESTISSKVSDHSKDHSKDTSQAPLKDTNNLDNSSHISSLTNGSVMTNLNHTKLNQQFTSSDDVTTDSVVANTTMANANFNEAIESSDQVNTNTGNDLNSHVSNNSSSHLSHDQSSDQHDHDQELNIVEQDKPQAVDFISDQEMNGAENDDDFSYLYDDLEDDLADIEELDFDKIDPKYLVKTQAKSQVNANTDLDSNSHSSHLSTDANTNHINTSDQEQQVHTVELNLDDLADLNADFDEFDSDDLEEIELDADDLAEIRALYGDDIFLTDPSVETAQADSTSSATLTPVAKVTSENTSTDSTYSSNLDNTDINTEAYTNTDTETNTDTDTISANGELHKVVTNNVTVSPNLDPEHVASQQHVDIGANAQYLEHDDLVNELGSEYVDDLSQLEDGDLVIEVQHANGSSSALDISSFTNAEQLDPQTTGQAVFTGTNSVNLEQHLHQHPGANFGESAGVVTTEDDEEFESTFVANNDHVFLLKVPVNNQPQQIFEPIDHSKFDVQNRVRQPTIMSAIEAQKRLANTQDLSKIVPINFGDTITNQYNKTDHKDKSYRGDNVVSIAYDSKDEEYFDSAPKGTEVFEFPEFDVNTLLDRIQLDLPFERRYQVPLYGQTLYLFDLNYSHFYKIDYPVANHFLEIDDYLPPLFRLKLRHQADGLTDEGFKFKPLYYIAEPQYSTDELIQIFENGDFFNIEDDTELANTTNSTNLNPEYANIMDEIIPSNLDATISLDPLANNGMGGGNSLHQALRAQVHKSADEVFSSNFNESTFNHESESKALDIDTASMHQIDATEVSINPTNPSKQNGESAHATITIPSSTGQEHSFNTEDYAMSEDELSLMFGGQGNVLVGDGYIDESSLPQDQTPISSDESFTPVDVDVDLTTADPSAQAMGDRIAQAAQALHLTSNHASNKTNKISNTHSFSGDPDRRRNKFIRTSDPNSKFTYNQSQSTSSDYTNAPIIFSEPSSSTVSPEISQAPKSTKPKPAPVPIPLPKSLIGSGIRVGGANKK